MAGQDQKPKTLGLSVLLVCDKLQEPTALGRAARALLADLKTHEVGVTTSLSAADARDEIAVRPASPSHHPGLGPAPDPATPMRRTS